MSELKSENQKIELIKIKKILIALILLVAVLVVIMFTATTFSTLSYRVSKLDDESANRISQNTIAQSYCGAGQWHRIAFLNMSDPSQQCPPAWRDYYNITGVRACGKQVNNSGSCQAIFYTTGQQYKVCGRVSGYQFVSPDAFEGVASNDIDLDGINITHGAQQNHIWSYAAGITQNYSAALRGKCSCTGGLQPSSFIGNHYYCDSGNSDDNYKHNHLYSDHPLWNGQQCEGTCHTGANSPPWFNVQLPAPITDAIEVSICCDQSTGDEDVPVELIEIFVQ